MWITNPPKDLNGLQIRWNGMLCPILHYRFSFLLLPFHRIVILVPPFHPVPSDLQSRWNIKIGIFNPVENVIIMWITNPPNDSNGLQIRWNGSPSLFPFFSLCLNIPLCLRVSAFYPQNPQFCHINPIC